MKRDHTPEQITATNRKLDRLKTLYIDGLIDLDTYKADRADLMTRLEDLQRKAAECHTEDTEAINKEPHRQHNAAGVAFLIAYLIRRHKGVDVAPVK